jgi:hypothetical protein
VLSGVGLSQFSLKGLNKALNAICAEICSSEVQNSQVTTVRHCSLFVLDGSVVPK